jgi:DNA mismatch repair protein MutL
MVINLKQIAVLDQNTIDKIAAGEVVERPSSVVKELVENAIDAGATAVTVEIKEGGISFIRITDNGTGIEKEQVSTAFLRHATSKIKSIEDLIGVSSLGFRGEALSSIAAVSQVELITKTAQGLTGVRYLIEGGIEKGLEEIGAPEGTTFLVRNLFYNTPARKKFLKSPTTEAGYISSLLEHLALSHPNISFKFINNQQTKLHTSGNTNLKDIIYGVYGREVANQLISIDLQMEDVKIEGFIGKPTISRGNRNYESYYINGRYIKSKLISQAVEDAYKTFMMQHKYPFAVLHFTIAGHLLDVNVHPNKMELRFDNQEQIYQFIYNVVKDGLSQKELIPEVLLSKEKSEVPQMKVEKKIPEPFEKRRLEEMKVNKPNSNQSQSKRPITDTYSEKQAYNTPIQPIDFLKGLENSPNISADISNHNAAAIRQEMIDKMENENAKEYIHGGLLKESSQYETSQNVRKGEEKEDIQSKAFASEISESAKAQQLDLFEEKLLEQNARSRHQFIGQVFDTYWLVQFEDKLYLIDQHAAHEKVMYERIIAGLKSKEHTSQYISPPVILTLSMQEEEILKKYMEHFEKIGFLIEPFGGREYSVRAVPGNLYSIAHKDLLIEMLDGLNENMGTTDSHLITEKIASVSCKAAVKGNHRLSLLEAQALVDELLTLENPYNCPHGRPTIISMSKYELEKKFKRIV